MDGPFRARRVAATIAWLFALGGRIPISEEVAAVLRIEYRIRYYVSRSDGNLEGDIVHGTQNVATFAGVAWSFGPK